MAFKPEPYHGKAKPILFKSDMVRAILSGQKTQTRRPVKFAEGYEAKSVEYIGGTSWHSFWGSDVFVFSTEAPKVVPATQTSIDPQYRIDDILYVRETWGVASIYDNMKPSDIGIGVLPGVAFPATDRTKGIKLRPSIHMPKWAARIFLEVTNVRCERLKEITEEEAIREGFDTYRKFLNSWDKIYPAYGENPFVWIYEFKRIDRSELPEN